jgi:hypothetical protein
MIYPFQMVIFNLVLTTMLKYQKLDLSISLVLLVKKIFAARAGKWVIFWLILSFLFVAFWLLCILIEAGSAS